MEKWSLEGIYPSFESQEFTEDFDKLSKLIEHGLQEHLDLLDDTLDASLKLPKVLKYIEKIQTISDKLFMYCGLKYQENMLEQEALMYRGKVFGVYAPVQQLFSKYNEWLPEIDNIDYIIKNDAYLKNLDFFIHKDLDEAKHHLSSEVQGMVNNFRTTGSNSWVQLFNTLTSSLTIEYDGKVQPISQVMYVLRHPNKDVRKSVYEQVIEKGDQIADSVASAFYAVKRETNYIATLENYSSSLEKRAVECNIECSNLTQFLEVVEENIHIAHKYVDHKKKLLQVHKVPYYDLMASSTKTNRTFTVDKSKEIILNAFRKYSDDAVNLVHKAFNNKWIDFYPRLGKFPVGYSSAIRSIKETRISTQHDDSFFSLIVLAHELGHSYHLDVCKEDSIFNIAYTPLQGEMCSTFFQRLMIMEEMKKSEEDTLFFLEQLAIDAIWFLTDIYSWYRFEKDIIEASKKHPINGAFLKETMINAQKFVYGDSIDETKLFPYNWVFLPFLLYANYYNWQYVFVYLLSVNLYNMFEDNPKDFVKTFDRVLKESGKQSEEELLSMMGIDIRSRLFWENSFKLIEEMIDKYIDATTK